MNVIFSAVSLCTTCANAMAKHEILAKDLKNRNNPRSKSKQKNLTSQSAYEQSE